MESNTTLGRALAPTLIVTMSIIGIPLPAHAAGEKSPPERVLTWRGQPLSEVLGHASHAPTRPHSSHEGIGPVVLFVAQDQTGAQRGDEPQGMSGRKKFWIAAGVGGASGALLGWAAGAEHCRNETTSVDPDQNCVMSTSSAGFGALFGLLGFGIGAGVGALIAR